MSTYRVIGGSRLHGAVSIHGAKNSVLPILAAAVLGRGVSIIHHCPHIEDVRASIAILRHLGCRVTWEADTVMVDATNLDCGEVPDKLMREMRSSVIFLGAILARTGECVMCYPGGCELGPRPIDLHLAALRAMGGTVEESGGSLRCTAHRLVGCEISLSTPSVGATENAMLAACGAQGTTTITNAAREPEIADLQGFLQSMGANIRGAGSSTITVEGGGPLHPGEYTVMGDRIVAATCLAAVALAGGEAELVGVDYRHLSTVTATLCEAGCIICSDPERICIRSDNRLRAVRPIRTSPYPGFPTDAQALLMAAMAGAEGTTVFVENMFSSRYRHVGELCRMGAEIRVEDRVAVVCGVPKLSGAPLRCDDLRGGAALVVAAVGAEGESTVTGLHHIDRGYEDLAGNLGLLGAQIIRLN